ncbi:efflux RND transporter periplasmic adaptor subunit [Rhodobacteraceae bacterium 2CG4]|uniref:Efflux RND transporter periplasmic adaptor subunit n=1 Tax=Halovulum marinum TaxID=2662447 RepID=A0A6L5Z1Q4_9RHOB|nr:efflux RND transporter periplasmic adaptor subunit [Halovulum marinum]MSU90428.1 efflux RND transporter periplasmic adaptor subunit [Halovulum marinum]
MRHLTTLIVLLSLGAVPVAAQEAPRPVKLMTVQAGESGLSRVFFGHVVARETVDMAFQVGGQIVELPVVEGAHVPAGALIARLDTEPFELALDQARLQLDQAERDLERLTKLRGAAVSEVTVDDASTAANLARIAVRRAERDLENATLTAPFDALVASRNVASFSTIAAGTPVVRLHDMSDLRIDINVPEILFQRAGRDPDVTLTASFPAAERSFPLEIREFNAQASQVGQTYTLTLGMTPPEDLAILPGSSAVVTATLREPGTRIVVPPSAVVPQPDGGAHVMVFHPDEDGRGSVERRAVEIRPTADGQVAVSAGLEAGEEIVLAGAAALDDGQTVRRFAGFPN